eukprot:15477703-Alexandrium_andersonii.AAC.1
MAVRGRAVARGHVAASTTSSERPGLRPEPIRGSWWNHVSGQLVALGRLTRRPPAPQQPTGQNNYGSEQCIG